MERVIAKVLSPLLLAALASCGGEAGRDGGVGAEDAGDCEPACAAGTCGTDGCGGVCGCLTSEVCIAEVCAPGGVIRSTVEAFDTGAGAEVSVTVPIDGDRSFMVVATTETDALLAVIGIRDPSGARILRWQDWVSADEALTSTFWATDPATVVNWPVRASDPPLVSGDYVVRLGSYQPDGVTPRRDIPIEVTTLISSDQDLEHGLVHVLVLYADGLAEDAGLVYATERAVAHWEDVWAGAGMEVSVRYESSTINPALPYPDVEGGPTMLEASRHAEEGEVVVLVGETIVGSPSTYGVSGQIPGPIVESSMSGIVVAWLTNAGPDGVFSDTDIRLYGEVLAHEVGHYVGLYHPVAYSHDYWDALADTPRCSTRSQCISVLGRNVMYPYSVCEDDVCISTTELTEDQQGVMQRYTGTL